MKQVTLNVSSREDFGRSASRNLRQGGVVPAVIYGESGVRHLALEAHAFQMAYRSFAGRAALLELKVEGHEESTFAIIQELQRNPRTDAVVHVDFKEIVRGREMEADIPVEARGTPIGVRNYGGVLEISMYTLRVRCRPRNLPESIVIDVTDLQIGHSLHLSDLTPPEGVTFLDDPEFVVVACVGASSGAPAVSGEGEGEESEAGDEAEASATREE